VSFLFIFFLLSAVELTTSILHSLYGELTDIGRQSTFEIGQRIRRLYIDRLGLLPEPSKLTAQDADKCYFRSTNMSRTVESLQQIVAGLFSDPNAASAAAAHTTAAPIILQGPSSDSASASTSALPDAFSPRLLVRDGSIEDLLPNTYVCAAFRALDQHFASAAAQTWNPYLAKHDAKIMPHTDDGRTAIRVDSHPRLNGILDTINASLAHGVAVPRPFTEDKQLLRDMERAVVTEWFSGYFAKDEKVRSKYRRLGMGRFLNSVADSMEARATPSLSHLPGNKLRLGVYAAHDTSLSGILCTLDAFEDRWPAFTASLGFELFKDTAPNVQPGVFSRIGGMLGLTAPAPSPHCEWQTF
jgi:acid phosphatase